MEILENQLKNKKISNAYIFENINSESNLKNALEFSKKIFELYNISSNIENNPDITVINNENTVISIEDVRSLIRYMYLNPNNGLVKIYIINHSENLRIESSNALLKSIEDPNDYCIIIFLTNNSDSLLATIRSRCQIIKFLSEKNKEEVEIEKLSNILYELMSGNLSFYYENKDFFEGYKDKKETLINSILDFYSSLIRYKYTKEEMYIKDKKELFYIKKLDHIPFDTISNIIKKVEEIGSGFSNNVNYDLSIENFVFYVYREVENKC